MEQSKVDDKKYSYIIGNNAGKVKKELMDLMARNECEIKMVSSQIERLRHATAAGDVARLV